MKLDDTSKILLDTIQIIEQWNSQGYIPSIQIDNTLNNLANAYNYIDQLKNQNQTQTNNINQNKIINQINKTTETQKKQLTDGHTLFNTSIPQQLLQQFIDELFWRDKTFFDNEITKLEKLTTLEDALIYIGEKYNWTPNNKPAEKFIELLDNYYA